MSSPLRVPTPRLHIISTSALFPHEQHDWQRSTALMERLRVAHTLTNPPIVAPIDDDHYVVLDGANRFHSLSALGYPQILCQVVDYHSEFVHLDTWYHLLTDGDAATVRASVQQLSSTQETAVEVATLHFVDGDTLPVYAAHSTLAAKNTLLCELTAACLQCCTVHRTTLTEVHDLLAVYPKAFARVEFTPYTAGEIRTSAYSGTLLPPGVTRHIIHGRALQLEYPLEILRDETIAIETKNEHLQEWIIQKMSQRAVRFYSESIFQFNE